MEMNGEHSLRNVGDKMRHAVPHFIAAGILLAGCDVVYSQGINIEAVAYHAAGRETPTERHIENGIKRGFGVADYIVRCVPHATVLDSAPYGIDHSTAATTPFWLDSPLPIMFVENDICNYVEEFREHPDFPTEDEVGALRIITHEYSHDAGAGTAGGRATGETNEGITDCYALQRVGQLAAGLGATPDEQYDAARLAIDRYMPRSAEYMPPVECQDGGKYDLDPTHPGGYFLPPATWDYSFRLRQNR
jgi:hypothetical protein